MTCVGVQVGSRLCSYGSAGQPRGMACASSLRASRPADRGQPLQKIMEAVWAISSESDTRSSHASIVFPSLRRIL